MELGRAENQRMGNRTKKSGQKSETQMQVLSRDWPDPIDNVPVDTGCNPPDSGTSAPLAVSRWRLMSNPPGRYTIDNRDYPHIHTSAPPSPTAQAGDRFGLGSQYGWRGNAGLGDPPVLVVDLASRKEQPNLFDLLDERLKRYPQSTNGSNDSGGVRTYPNDRGIGA